MNLEIAKSRILDVVDYPKTGITFKDITPLLADTAAFNYVITALADKLTKLEIDVVAGVEARGFIIGAALANQLQKASYLFVNLANSPAKRYGANISSNTEPMLLKFMMTSLRRIQKF